MASLHPSHGARIVLERDAAKEQGGARYRVSVYEPELVHTSVAELDAAGAVRLAEWSGAPPRWTVLFIERLLKGMPKKHAADASWPRRIVRWREARE